jgi:hypothetical protein
MEFRETTKRLLARGCDFRRNLLGGAAPLVVIGDEGASARHAPMARLGAAGRTRSDLGLVQGFARNA